MLITLGTDGQTNWIRLPNNTLLNLGPISPLKLVSRLAKNRKEAHSVLKNFNASQEVMLRVDEAELWKLLEPKRVRFAQQDSIVLNASNEGTMSSDILSGLDAIEQHVTALTKAASIKVASKKMTEGCQILEKLVQKVKTATSKEDWEKALKEDESLLKKVEADLSALEKGEKVENLTLENAKQMVKSLKQVIENKKKLLQKMASSKVASSEHVPSNDLVGSLTDIEQTLEAIKTACAAGATHNHLEVSCRTLEKLTEKMASGTASGTASEEEQEDEIQQVEEADEKRSEASKQATWKTKVGTLGSQLSAVEHALKAIQAKGRKTSATDQDALVGVVEKLPLKPV